MPLSATVRPFIGGGVGYYSTKATNQPTFAYGAPTGSEIGYHANAGIDYLLSHHWIVGLEGRYAFLKGNAVSLTNISERVSLNYGLISLAIRYVF